MTEDLTEMLVELEYAAVGDHWWQLEREEFIEALRKIRAAAWDEGNNQPDSPLVVNPYRLGRD